MYTDFPLLMKSSIMSWHTSFKKYEKHEEYGSRWEKPWKWSEYFFIFCQMIVLNVKLHVCSFLLLFLFLIKLNQNDYNKLAELWTIQIEIVL